MNSILVVLIKEVIDNFRDKKTMASSMLMGSLLGPIIFVIMINITVKANNKEAHATIDLPIQNQQYAEGFIQFLKRQSVNIETIEGDPDELIKQRTKDVILVIDPTFPKQFADGAPAKIKIYYNAAKKGAGNVKINRIKNLISQYSQGIGATRMQLRGVHPQLSQVILLESHDTSTAETRAASFLSFMPFFLMMGIFIGGMYLAIDATAGEKERGSLEPLLINPASRAQIITGKLSATVIFSTINLIVSIIGFKICLYFLPVKELGFELTLHASSMIILVLLLLPVCLLASSVQIIIGTYSKGFREAQTYTGLLTLAPMLPMMIFMMMPIKEKLWMMTIPIMSQNILIEKLLGNQPIDYSYFAVAILSTSAIGAACALIAIKLYQRENVLFSK